jgi:hypothetical protein
MELYLTLFILFGSVIGLASAGIFAIHLVFEYMHPKNKQNRKHRGREWQYKKVPLPVKSVSGDRKELFVMDVKYCEETGEVYRKNYRPRCEGVRFEKNWIKIPKDSSSYEKAVKHFDS